jgi:hypothetical protein
MNETYQKFEMNKKKHHVVEIKLYNEENEHGVVQQMYVVEIYHQQII